MNDTASEARLEPGADGTLHARGHWTLAAGSRLWQLVEEASRREGAAPTGAVPTGAAPTGVVRVDCAGVEALDTAGAHALTRLRARTGAEIVQLKQEYRGLLDQVERLAGSEMPPPPRPRSLFHRIGETTVMLLAETRDYLAFVGETAVAGWRVLLHPTRFRMRATLSVFETAGWGALPILGLLSFLIGVVVAYQAGVQLSDYGANIFVADLIGLAVLREFGPLLTAIIVAGRTGSAFTAEIGTMKVTEEIDALRTIGVSPHELLVLPKLAALVIIMPLLTVFADILGIFGGMVMAQQMLSVNFYDFIDRFQAAVDMSDYLTGIGKAPVFALLIGSVGCHQGFQVGSSADSVGRHTTRSVVQSIFLIIVADALFSVIFNMLDL